MNGIDKITDKILSEARADADAIIASASSKCAEIMFRASKESEDIKAALDERAARDAESMIASAKSDAAMQKRDLLMAARAREVDKAFESAYKEIMRLPEERYCKLVASFIADALLSELENERVNRELYGDTEGLPEKFELVFNKNDREKYSERVIKELERIVIGKMSRETLTRLCVAEDCADIDGGVILRLGSIECNCSLEAVFNSVREKMEIEIAEYLFSDN